MGIIVKMSFEEKILKDWINELKIYDSEKNDQGAIYMYVTIIFKDLL